MQKTLRTSLGILILTATIASVGSRTAQADAPQPASGDFVVEHLQPTFAEEVGGVSFIELTATFRLEGTLDGAFDADFSIIHLGALDEPARQIFIAEGTFEGEVDGASGSFDFIFVGDIDDQGFAEGELVVIRGTDELANLSGQLTLAGLAGVAGAYEGTIHFAP